jgi:hypothetical protein
MDEPPDRFRAWPDRKRRWIEHILGERFHNDFPLDAFGNVRQIFDVHGELLDRVLAMVKAGDENLDVLCWATSNGIPQEPVLEILEALDTDLRRLSKEDPPNPDLVIG